MVVFVVRVQLGAAAQEGINDERGEFVAIYVQPIGIYCIRAAEASAAAVALLYRLINLPISGQNCHRGLGPVNPRPICLSDWKFIIKLARMGNLVLKCILPIKFRIEYRLTICQLNWRFTRNNDLKSIKSLFKDDSHGEAPAAPPAPTPELLTLSSSNFHHWAEPFSGPLTLVRAAASNSDPTTTGDDEDWIFERKAPEDLIVLLLILDGTDALSATAGDRNPLRWTAACDDVDDDDVVGVLGCCYMANGLIESQDKIKCLSFTVVCVPRGRSSSVNEWRQSSGIYGCVSTTEGLHDKPFADWVFVLNCLAPDNALFDYVQ